MRVGTRYTPLAFISFSVSSLRKLPCSIESTPAAMASLAAVSPWQCAAACGDLDDVCTPLHLVAHRLAALLGAGADALDRSPRLHAIGRQGVVVEVPAGRADAVHRGEHARAL